MFQGYIAAVVTPFRDGKADFVAFEKYVDWLSGSGISGIVVCGSTGESLSLTAQEQKDLIECANRVVNGRIKLIGGVISSSTSNCLELIKNSEQYVDGFLCICPYYIKPTQAQIVSHFSKLSANTGHPIILYNNPGRVGTSIGKEAFDCLMRLKNVAAIKECANDLSRFTLWRQGLNRDFDFLTGNDDSAFGALAMGAVGVVSVSANVCPTICAKAYDSFMKGDLKNFARLRDALAPLHSLMFAEPSPAPAKYALSKMGIMTEEIREPLTPISSDLRKKIDEFLEKISDVQV